MPNQDREGLSPQHSTPHPHPMALSKLPPLEACRQAERASILVAPVWWDRRAGEWSSGAGIPESVTQKSRPHLLPHPLHTPVPALTLGHQEQPRPAVGTAGALPTPPPHPGLETLT